MATPKPVPTPVPGAGLPWRPPAAARAGHPARAGPQVPRAPKVGPRPRALNLSLTRPHLPPALLHLADRAGPLESPWVAAGFGAALLASVALAVWRWRRGRARQRLLGARGGARRGLRWLRRGGLAVWLTSLAALTGLASLNSYVGYVPSLPALFGSLPGGGSPGAGGSQVVKVTISAPKLGMRPATTYVYLPPGYGARSARSHRYPVVYLLHGFPGGPIDWFRAAHAQQVMDAMIADGLARPMILVAPPASGGWLYDSEMLNQVGGPQVETYLTSTVVHVIDSRFRTVAGRAGRAIGGMSSGGYGALNLGLRHQDTFSVILSMMPYGTPGNVIDTLLGGSRALWLANSPDYYIPTMRFRHRIWVDLLAGPHDQELPEARRLAAMLRARGQPAVFTEVPGAGHTWRAARLELPYALAFASAHLAGGRPAAHRIPLARGQQLHPGMPADERRRATVA